jgi:hypothetical protein
LPREAVDAVRSLAEGFIRALDHYLLRQVLAGQAVFTAKSHRLVQQEHVPAAPLLVVYAAEADLAHYCFDCRLTLLNVTIFLRVSRPHDAQVSHLQIYPRQLTRYLAHNLKYCSLKSLEIRVPFCYRFH